MRRLLGLTGVVAALALAVPGAAFDSASFEARAEYLLRQMDAGVMPTRMLVAMLGDPYPETRVMALRVVASSADPSQQVLLQEMVRDRDFRVRYEAMIAAGRLGEAGRNVALRGLRDEVPKVRQAAAWAATHGGPDALDPLATIMAEEPDVGVRATALANLWRFDVADWVRLAAAAATEADAQLRRAAAYSLARSGRADVRPALRRLAVDREAVIRATAVAGLGRAALGEDDLALLVRALADDDSQVRAAACGALARQSTPALPDDATAAVATMWTPLEPQLAVMALRAAGARPEIGSDAALVQLASREEPWLAAEALIAAARRGAAGAQDLARAWWADGEPWQRRAVAAVAPELGADWEKAAAGDDEPAVRLAWLESLDDDRVATRLGALRRRVAEDPDPVVRTVALTKLGEAGAAGGFRELLDLAASWRGDELPDARAAALAAALPLAVDDDQRELVLGRALDDRDPAVAVLVVNAARSLGLPARSQEREPRHNGQWYADLVEWMLGRHWLDVTTDRGTFRVRLDSIDAPISARETFDLAATGFYDGLSFHRVVPNFVVQGGDPRGDGWGGPGFILPDEPAYSPFDTAHVGIATSGPNTGGSQLFVTLMPADHLTGHYTNLGEVVAGREVLARLRQGDRIRSVEAISGDEPPPPTPVLLGRLAWAELEALPGWLEEYQAAAPDPEAVARLGQAKGSYDIVTVLGSWCGDSQREVPRLVRVLDDIGIPVFEHTMIGVDRTRRIDDAGLADASGVARTVERVPTMVVFDGDGVELGRVVETAERPIEELLVSFITPAEGW